MLEPGSDSSCFAYSGHRFAVEYRLTGPPAEARSRAKLLCNELTVESADHLIPNGPIRDHVLGRVVDFEPLTENLSRAVLTFPAELVDGSLASLLHTVFGTASLQPGVRLVDIRLPDHIAIRWSGPRLGRRGLRTLLTVPERPLVCAVLKPIGLSAKALAALAYEFALGGVDLIKDDQGLADPPFCPFEERVARCGEAVARARTETGKPCLYVPHLSGPWPTIAARAALAKRQGAGGFLVCPGLVGFDHMAELTRLTEEPCVLLSHPALLGTYYASAESGIAPAVLFGLLPRLAGADVSIYPTFGLSYPLSQAGCREIADSCSRPIGTLAPVFPTAAGRMDVARVPAVAAIYGRELVYVLGSGIREDPRGIRPACQDFIRTVSP